MPRGRLLEMTAADCSLMKPSKKPRRYEARCGIRYVVEGAGPLPADAPARAARPRLDSQGGAQRKRRGSDGLPPIVGQVRRQGTDAVTALCLGLWRGHPHRSASDETVFLDLCRSLRLICNRCGGRGGEVGHPAGNDGTVAGFRMPGADEASAA